MSILPNGSINTETIKCTSKFVNYNYNTESFFNNNNTNKYAFSTKEVSSKAVERLAYKDYYNGRYGFSIIFTYHSSQKELYDEFLQNLKSYFKTPGISEVH